MEAKKNPGHDVHRLSFRFFVIGLTISVSIAIVAFEWTTEKITYVTEPADPMAGYIQVTSNSIEHYSEPFQKLKTERKTQTQLVNLITSTESTTGTSPFIDASDPLPPNSEQGLSIEIEPEYDSTEIIVFAEDLPMPVGGYEQFYTQISKNLKYPKQAIRQHVDGKVFVEFVVGRNGLVNNMKVLKGIGSGCDEEALRVLALTEWEPGRQRGRPVNVRMVIPVYFKIH